MKTINQRNVMLMNIRRALATVAAAAIFVGIGGTAFAATNGPSLNLSNEAGYQISSQVNFNEVRTIASIAPGSTSTVELGLESSVDGGSQYDIGLVYSAGNYFLEDAVAHGVSQQAGIPSTALTWTPIATDGIPAGAPLFSAANGGTYYLEVHNSTRSHDVAFVAGPSETDVATLDNATGAPMVFNAPNIEVVNTHAGPAALQASFFRSGVTEPAGSNAGGIAGTRVTFDFFNVDLTQDTATQDVSLALPQTSSAFAVSSQGAFAFPVHSNITTAVTHLTSRADSGGNGNWAVDDITRTVAVTNHGHVALANCGGGATDCYSYTATLSDAGTFVTDAGAFTPNQGGGNVGDKILSTVHGNLNGSGTFTFDASRLPDASLVPVHVSGNADSTSTWTQQFFPAGTVFTGAGLNNDWSWTYHSANKTPVQSWVDSAANGGGQSAIDGNITG
jgi:hypothetical protein